MTIEFYNSAAFQRAVASRMATHQPDLEVVDASPQKDCKMCYGRGYQGIDHTTKERIPCHCLHITAKEVSA